MFLATKITKDFGRVHGALRLRRSSCFALTQPDCFAAGASRATINRRTQKPTYARYVRISCDVVLRSIQICASAIGNATPVDLTLGKLTVTGYDAPTWDDEEEEWVDSCAGDFVVQFLTTSGTVDAKYAWYDNGEKTVGWYNTNGYAIEGGANSG